MKEGLSVLGVLIDPVDYESATRLIIDAAHKRLPFAVSALAVHGVMTGVLDAHHGYRLNRLDLVVPDGQPVRWAMNIRHKAGLKDRVYGPELTLRICERAAIEGLPIALYGSNEVVSRKFAQRLSSMFPRLEIAFQECSRFRALTNREEADLASRVRSSGARIALIGLGCPRQEVFVFENREAFQMPLLAVGAAFDFHAGTLRQAPRLMQQLGLEWLFRLGTEPRRLWKRYATLNPLFVGGFLLQLLRVRKFDEARAGIPPTEPLRIG